MVFKADIFGSRTLIDDWQASIIEADGREREKRSFLGNENPKRTCIGHGTVLFFDAT